MLYNIDLNESNYVQPVRGFIGRELQNNNTELVDFVPESHIRIWYNTQLEGYPSHHHSAVEVIICMQSDYVVIVNNEHYTLHPGDIMIVPPHTIHKLICPTPGIRFVFLINLEPYTSFQDYKTMQPMFLKPLYIAPHSSHHYETLYNNFAKMIEIYFKNDIFWETDIFSLFFKNISICAKDYFGSQNAARASIPPDVQKEHYDKFSKLLIYIDEHYADDLNLEDTAAIVGFSKFHFSRLFKQYTNTTFYDYLCKKRITRAQEMLAENIPVTTIAYQTGFNTPSAFCRCFKKYTGYSPSEFRSKSEQAKIDADFH
ncbi:MAG: AraC family transcriptional regulator [Lachnospiraceae bacterium]|nr:AraC family transcriptional regulator [Lachnospiraceae bacterium]